MLHNSAGNHLPHGEEVVVTTQHVKSDSNKVTSLGWLASPYLNWPTSTVQALTSKCVNPLLQDLTCLPKDGLLHSGPTGPPGQWRYGTANPKEVTEAFRTW
jgi:hypothetical protein